MSERLYLGVAVGSTGPAARSTTPEPTVAGVSAADVPTVQNDIPLPYIAGQGIHAVAWLSPIYNRTATRMPYEQPSKK